MPDRVDNTRVIRKELPEFIYSPNDGEILEALPLNWLDKIKQKILNYSNKHYWNPILGAPARWLSSMKSQTNPIVGISKTAVPAVEGAAILTGLGSIPTMVRTIATNPYGLQNVALLTAPSAAIGYGAYEVGNTLDKYLLEGNRLFGPSLGLGSIYGINKIPFMQDLNQAISRRYVSSKQLDKHMDEIAEELYKKYPTSKNPEQMNKILQQHDELITQYRKAWQEEDVEKMQQIDKQINELWKDTEYAYSTQRMTSPTSARVDPKGTIKGVNVDLAAIYKFKDSPNIEIHMGGKTSPKFEDKKFMAKVEKNLPRGTYISPTSEGNMSKVQLIQNGIYETPVPRLDQRPPTIDGYVAAIHPRANQTIDWSVTKYWNNFHYPINGTRNTLLKSLWDTFTSNPTKENLSQLNNYLTSVGGKPIEFINNEPRIPIPIIYKK